MNKRFCRSLPGHFLIWLWIGPLLLPVLSGCANRNSSAIAPQAVSARPVGKYTISGQAVSPGAHALELDDTVANVIARNLKSAPGKSVPIILIRNSPDGKTRQFIELNATGKLMDETQNYNLRDGDELIFPE